MKAKVINTGDVIDVVEVGDQVFADSEGNEYQGYELDFRVEPDWREMAEILNKNHLVQPASSIAIEFMRSHPNAPAKKVVAFTVEVINGIKDL